MTDEQLSYEEQEKREREENIKKFEDSGYFYLPTLMRYLDKVGNNLNRKADDHILNNKSELSIVTDFLKTFLEMVYSTPLLAGTIPELMHLIGRMTINPPEKK